MARDEEYRAYLQAERKIAVARSSGATELNLCNMNLTELPESIGELTQLQKLELGLDYSINFSERNQLTTLPQSLGNLTQLQSLDLFCNRLATLPEWLGRLTKLQSLNLRQNKLTTLPEWLGQLTQLKELNLAGNKLTKLPESLRQLTQLKEMDIAANQLTTLPEWLGQLAELESLDLSHNQLTTLPESLGQLTQLQSLRLVYNRLTILSEALGQLTQLQSLDLSHNKLTTLPGSLGNLRNLRKLYLFDSGFELLPIQVCRLQALEILILGTGRYSEVSEHITSMSTHKGILKQLPIELGDLSSLTVLLLGSNQITDIPSSLIQLHSLKVLDLEHNPLNPKLAAAYGQGLAAVKNYLRDKANARKLKVFLCHASQDKHIVYELYEKFIAEDWIEPWLDAKKLLPGQDWQAEIKNAVETADNVIIFLSNASINKDGFVQKELRLAKDIALEKSEGSVFLIPLRLDDCEVPKSLQFYQWANFFGGEQEQTYNKLLESLKLRLEDINRKRIFTNQR